MVILARYHCQNKWALFISQSHSSFSVLSMPHVHKLEARAFHKIIFYRMRLKLWWCTLYSKPVEEMCYLSYEDRFWPVAKICLTL